MANKTVRAADIVKFPIFWQVKWGDTKYECYAHTFEECADQFMKTLKKSQVEANQKQLFTFVPRCDTNRTLTRTLTEVLDMLRKKADQEHT